MLQMIRSNTTGEVMVINTVLGTACEALPADEQNQPLEQYQLDYELGEYTDTDYTVIRVED